MSGTPCPPGCGTLSHTWPATCPREEDGIFAALRRQGDYVDEVDDLEGEHRWLDAAIADLDPESPELLGALTELFDALDLHIQREDLGIFPVSVVTLGAEEWNLVQRAHDEQPSFLDTAAGSDGRRPA